MKKIYSILQLLAVILFPIASGAQITVTAGSSAAALAGKLVGPGVTVLNPTVTCHDSARGIFIGTSTLSFDSGVVLSSGRARSLGPGMYGCNILGAGTASSQFASQGWTLPGD